MKIFGSVLCAQYAYRDPTRFGEFSTIGSTTLSPIAVAVLLVVLGLVFCARRQVAVLAAIGLVMFVPSGQRVVIAGIDFAFVRIIAIALGIRVLSRSESRGSGRSYVDALVVVLCLWPPIAAIFRGASDVLLNSIGQGGDRLLLYLAGRSLIRSRDDVLLLTRGLVLLAIPIAVFFIVEKATARNLFATFGGVSPITQLREGSLRAQGAFAHPILAGTWWAAMIPLFLGLRWSAVKAQDRMIGLIGVGVAFLIVTMTASSTPFAGVAGAMLAWALFNYRRSLGMVRSVAFCLALVLHFVHGPGLHHLLMAKFTFVSGSTGVHRYRLIDAAMNRVGEWGLVGGNSTYHWGWGLDDVTCQYVAAGLAGGLLQLGSLLMALMLSWRLVGRAIRGATTSNAGVAYGLGASLFVHAVCFLAVTYFGQIELLFWLTLGAVQSVCLREVLQREMGRDYLVPHAAWRAPAIASHA